MPESAVPRQGWTPGGDIRQYEQWLTTQLAQNPNYKLPPGYVVKGGRVVRDTHGLFDDIVKYLPYAGMAIAGGAGAGLFGGGGGGAAASATTAAVPSVGATAGLPGAASAGGASMAGFGLKDILQLAPIGLGLFKGHGGGDQVPMSNELEQILGLQRGRMEQTQPLYDALLRMAMQMMPISARGGMSGPPGMSGSRVAAPPPPQARYR